MKLRLLLPVFPGIASALLAFGIPACGTDPEPPPGGADAAATVLDGAAAPSDGGGPDGGAASPDADVSALGCEDLRRTYGEELLKARACTPTSLVNECTAARERVVGCGCTTYLNANAVGLLDKVAAEWTAKKCGPPACTDALCRVPTGGSCSGAGKAAECVDVFDR